MARAKTEVQLASIAKIQAKKTARRKRKKRENAKLREAGVKF